MTVPSHLLERLAFDKEANRLLEPFGAGTLIGLLRAIEVHCTLEGAELVGTA